MSRNTEDELLPRRSFLRGLAFCAVGAPLIASRVAGAPQIRVVPAPFPFKLGLQSYSLRKFALDDALDTWRVPVRLCPYSGMKMLCEIARNQSG